jgi:hypothetical protein
VCEEIRKTGANVSNEGNDEDGSQEEENVLTQFLKSFGGGYPDSVRKSAETDTTSEEQETNETIRSG